MIPVDAFDLKMLAALQDDGRLTNQQLADLVGLSASQCSRRRMRLEEEKVIAGYHADLAGEALGFNLIAFVHITLATHSPDNAKKFRALVNRVDDIQEAYSLTGDADYVLKVVLRDLKDLSDLVNNVLMPHQSVAHVRSSIVLDRLKESAKLPLRSSHGPNRGKSVIRFPNMICDHPLPTNPTRRSWRCNFGRTANIATRTCRRTLRKRGSAPTNARSARIASTTSCTMSVRTAAAVLSGGRSGPPSNGGPAYASTKQLPSDKRVHLKYSVEDVAAHCARLRDIPPQER